MSQESGDMAMSLFQETRALAGFPRE